MNKIRWDPNHGLPPLPPRPQEVPLQVLAKLLIRALHCKELQQRFLRPNEPVFAGVEEVDQSGKIHGLQLVKMLTVLLSSRCWGLTNMQCVKFIISLWTECWGESMLSWIWMYLCSKQKRVCLYIALRNCMHFVDERFRIHFEIWRQVLVREQSVVLLW